MPKRDGHESRKKYVDSAWLNPKHYKMDNQQRSSKQENVQRSFRYGSRLQAQSKWQAPYSEGEDMICAFAKAKGVRMHRRGLASHYIDMNELGKIEQKGCGRGYSTRFNKHQVWQAACY